MFMFLLLALLGVFKNDAYIWKLALKQLIDIFWKKRQLPLNGIVPFNILNTILWEEQYMQLFNQIFKNEARMTILKSKRSNI